MSAIRLENVPGILRETRVKVRQPDVRRKWGFWQQLRPRAGKSILQREILCPVVAELYSKNRIAMEEVITRKVRAEDLPQVADGMIPSAPRTLKQISEMRGSEPQKGSPRPFTLEEVFKNAGIRIPQELSLDWREALFFVNALDNSSRAEIFRQAGKELLAALKDDLRDRRGDRITDRGPTEFLSGETLKYIFWEIDGAAVVVVLEGAGRSDAARAYERHGRWGLFRALEDEIHETLRSVSGHEKLLAELKRHHITSYRDPFWGEDEVNTEIADAFAAAGHPDLAMAFDPVRRVNIFSRVGGWIISSSSVNRIRDLYLTFFLGEAYSRLLFRVISPEQRVALFDLLDAANKMELHETVGGELADLLDKKRLRELYIAYKAHSFSSEYVVQEIAGKLQLSKQFELFMALTPREKGEFLALLGKEKSKAIFAVMIDQEIKSVWEEIRNDENSVWFFLRSISIEKLRVLCQSLSDADREVVIRISSDSTFAGFVRLSNLIGSKDAYRRFSTDDRRQMFVESKEEDRHELLTLLDYEDLHDLFNLLSAKDKLGFAALVHTISPRFYRERVLPYLKGGA